VATVRRSFRREWRVLEPPPLSRQHLRQLNPPRVRIPPLVQHLPQQQVATLHGPRRPRTQAKAKELDRLDQIRQWVRARAKDKAIALVQGSSQAAASSARVCTNRHECQLVRADSNVLGKVTKVARKAQAVVARVDKDLAAQADKDRKAKEIKEIKGIKVAHKVQATRVPCLRTSK
jgi:hypothetical protein